MAAGQDLNQEYTFMMRIVRNDGQTGKGLQGLLPPAESYGVVQVALVGSKPWGREGLVDMAVGFRCLLPLTEVAMLQVSQSPLIQCSTCHPLAFLRVWWCECNWPP